MPVYLDSHEGTELAENMRDKMESNIRTGAKDAFGVVDLGIIIDKDDGMMHCVLDAPDVEAVKRHHESLKVPLESSAIHWADAILK